MTTAVQRRRGTNTEHASFTGLEGEISVNTTNESVHVHDGSTAGGFELMRADGANSTVTLGDISGVTAGTGLSGGGTTGTVTLDIDGTVATLAGTQTFTNKTLTSPILNTPTIGTSFTIGGATITETELEILDGATVTTTELNYVDGVTSAIQTQIDAKAPLASPSFTGNVSVGGTVDGRDLAADGTKLDGIEASADVTDTANVTAAGALMDSELTSEASVKALNQGVATTDSPAFAGLTVDTTTLAVDSTNNRVGIGTASPSAPLHVKSSGELARLETTSSGGNNYLAFYKPSDARKGFIGYGGGASDDQLYINNDENADIVFRPNNSEAMRIDSSGNVGIGTSAPSEELEIASSSPTIRLTDTDDSTYGSVSYNVGALLLGGDNTIRCSTGGSERMRIDSSGQVGIGTSAPEATLHIVDVGTTGPALHIAGGSSTEGDITTPHDETLQIGHWNESTDTFTERMQIATSGNVSTTGSIGVGRTSLASATEDAGLVLSEAGYIYSARVGTSSQSHIVFINNAAVNATIVGRIMTSGSTTSYNTSSDYRLKTDAQPMTGATARLKALKPVNFEWIADGTRVDGFLAHEAQEVVPECVSGEKDAMQDQEYEVTPAVLDEEGNTVEQAVMGTRSVPDYQGIDQSKLVPLLVATIQELEARITQLENN